MTKFTWETIAQELNIEIDPFDFIPSQTEWIVDGGPIPEPILINTTQGPITFHRTGETDTGTPIYSPDLPAT